MLADKQKEQVVELVKRSGMLSYQEIWIEVDLSRGTLSKVLDDLMAEGTILYDCETGLYSFNSAKPMTITAEEKIKELDGFIDELNDESWIEETQEELDKKIEEFDEIPEKNCNITDPSACSCLDGPCCSDVHYEEPETECLDVKDMLKTQKISRFDIEPIDISVFTDNIDLIKSLKKQSEILSKVPLRGGKHVKMVEIYSKIISLVEEGR